MKNPINLLISYLKKWKRKAIKASIYSTLNKIFDVAPEVLIGVAVDLVVKKNQSFVASLGFESINSQVLFIGGMTFTIWVFESFWDFLSLGLFWSLNPFGSFGLFGSVGLFGSLNPFGSLGRFGSSGLWVVESFWVFGSFTWVFLGLGVFGLWIF